MDKVTIVGQDGKPRYELGPNDIVRDYLGPCSCDRSAIDAFPVKIGDEEICPICYRVVKE